MSEQEQAARIRAFCNPQAPDVFHSYVGATEIWKQDPFDVEQIHAEVRQVFEDHLNHATSEPVPGRILTILGESGAGKTHLMRYFRHDTHQSGRGYFGYLQLTSPVPDYGQYVLAQLIDSLTHPYHQDSDTTGLMRLSNAVAAVPALQKKITLGNRSNLILTAIREWEFNEKGLAKVIVAAARKILLDPLFQGVDSNLIIAMLYLQVQDPLTKSIVINWLSGQPLSPLQQNTVQALAPSGSGVTPIQLIKELAKLMWATGRKPLVICVDQLEGVWYHEDRERLLNQALGTLVDISANVPSSLVVIACLRNTFVEQLKGLLTTPIRTKLTVPPSPFELKNTLESVEQAEALIAKRLTFLYDWAGVDSPEPTDISPFPDHARADLVGLRARQALNLCGEFHQHAMQHANIPARFPISKPSPPAADEEVSPIEAMEAQWQTFLTQSRQAVPVESIDLAWVLHAALPLCGMEIARAPSLRVTLDKTYVTVTGGGEPFIVCICNKKLQGGGLFKEFKALEQHAGNTRMVVARSAEYPRNSNSQAARFLGELIAKGARRVLVEEPDWRSLMAFPTFHAKFARDPSFYAWQHAMRPLTRFISLQGMLGLEDVGGQLQLRVEVKSKGNEEFVIDDSDPPDVPPEPVKATPPPSPSSPSQLRLGETPQARPVGLDPAELTRHAAFLGGTGSGKSTLAMNLIEQLLLQDIPVVLVDRKGDLASYANPEAWNHGPDTPELQARREAFRQKVDIDLFTPGHPLGRPLGISIVPDGTHLLPEHERDQIARYASAALADMMGLKTSLKDRACRAILHKAVFLLTEIHDPEEALLEEIIELIEQKDEMLLNLVGALDVKNFRHLHEALLIMKASRGHLFKSEGERIGADLLFGLGRFKRPKKTKLSIVSTKFFADRLDREFFVAQMLLELSRWISKHPASQLQAAILFDEADIYLPATRKPATKEPMEDLLKRARSGGLGVILATQSPGDFDYKSKENIRSWLIGRIKETTALNKLKPMLAQTTSDAVDQLGGLETGRFYLVRDGKAERLQGDLNAIPLEQVPEEEIVALARK